MPFETRVLLSAVRNVSTTLCVEMRRISFFLVCGLFGFVIAKFGGFCDKKILLFLVGEMFILAFARWISGRPSCHC